MTNKKENNFNNLVNDGNDPSRAFRRRLTFRLILFGGIFVVTIVVLFFISSSLKKEVDKIQMLRSENKWLLQSLDAIARLRIDNRRVQKFLKDLDPVLMTSLDVPSRIIPAIESRTVARGLTKTNIELSNENPAADSNLGSIDFSLQAEGVLADVVGFLSDVESSKAMLKIISFDISSVSGSNKSVLNFKGLIYTRK
ncbi:MAG: hypothetical protein QMD50_01965 [Patescibacteria group bacterium]|nr:hypothetical protein [Patescibacteria group bacterium]